MTATTARTQPAAKKAPAKKAAKKVSAPTKVRGILTLPNGKHEVVVFLGAFDRIEDAMAARERGLALREAIKRTKKGS